MTSPIRFGSARSNGTLLTLNLPPFMTANVGAFFAGHDYRVVLAGPDPMHLSEAVTQIEYRVPGAQVLIGLIKPGDERAVRHLLSSVGPEVSALHLHIEEAHCHGTKYDRIGVAPPAYVSVVTAIETAAALMTARAYGRILVTARKDPCHFPLRYGCDPSPVSQLEAFVASRQAEFMRRNTHIRLFEIQGNTFSASCAAAMHDLLGCIDTGPTPHRPRSVCLSGTSGTGRPNEKRRP